MRINGILANGKARRTLEDELYPAADGEPMGDTSIHMDATGDWYETLKAYFAKMTRVLILSNVFLYYERGNPAARRAPDVMVIKGVRKGPRRVYKLWEEKKVPNVAFEFISDKTWEEDLGDKRLVYAQVGIREYFLYDSEVRHLDRPLVGFRLVGDDYEEIAVEKDGSLISEELGLRLLPDGWLLRGIVIKTGERLPHVWELQAEAQRAYEAEREVARLKAEIRKLKKKRPPEA